MCVCVCRSLSGIKNLLFACRTRARFECETVWWWLVTVRVDWFVSFGLGGLSGSGG